MTRGPAWLGIRHGLSLACSLGLTLLLANTAQAIGVSAFGPGGQGGTLNGQTFDVGAGGSVFDMDAFLHVGGAGQQLSQAGSTVAGLGFQFAAALSADTTDLTLSYTFSNSSAASINNISFTSFLDAEIDEAVNTFFNEYATASGPLALGQNYEADEPGYAFGNLFQNAQAGALDGTNGVPQGSPDDVAMGLQFDIGTLVSGQNAVVRLMISEDGSSLGGFSLTQQDSDPGSTTAITYSGQAVLSTPPGPNPGIPEPSAALAFAVGGVLVLRGLRRTRN